MLAWIANLDRTAKKIIAFSADSIICVFAIWLAFSLRLGDWQLWNVSIRNVMLASFLFWPPIFLMFGVYRPLFRSPGPPTIPALAPALAPWGALWQPRRLTHNR